MKTESSEIETTADLSALAAAAHGRPAPRQVPAALKRSEVNERESRIAELKARYRSGDLVVDEKALVAKLLDLLLQERRPDSSGKKDLSP